jgi:hypothetical protein
MRAFDGEVEITPAQLHEIKHDGFRIIARKPARR